MFMRDKSEKLQAWWCYGGSFLRSLEQEIARKYL